MELVQQIDLVMPNVPNSLSRIGDKMRAAGVNIKAISCSEGTPNSTVHLIVDHPEDAIDALQQLGDVSTTDVIAFSMSNKPGAIGQIGRAIGAADVNIKNMFATTFGKNATVYVSVEDVHAVMDSMQMKDGKKQLPFEVFSTLFIAAAANAFTVALIHI